MSVGHQHQTKTRFGVLHVQRTWDADYEGKVPLLPNVLMLPSTKEQLASYECVGGNARRQAPTGTHVSVTEPVEDRPTGKESSDVKARAATVGLGSARAPIKIVDGRPL